MRIHLIQWRYNEDGESNQEMGMSQKKNYLQFQWFGNPVWSRIKLKFWSQEYWIHWEPFQRPQWALYALPGLCSSVHNFAYENKFKSLNERHKRNLIFSYYKHERVLARFVVVACFFRTIPSLHSSTLAEGSIK